MSSSAFTPSTTTVTNNVPVNVPVVTAWQAYTPVFSGVTATGSVYYRRVGDSIEVEGLVDCTAVASSTFKIPLPTGLSIDTTKISGNQKNTLGIISVSNGGGGSSLFAAAGISGVIIADSSDNNAVFVALLNASDASGNVTASPVQGGQLFNSTGQGTFRFTAPISQWSSGTTTLADRAVEEYAFNTSTSTTTSDTTSFGYGPNGWPIASITAQLDRTVRFQTAILPTDSIILEIKDDSTGNWTNVASGLGGNPLSLQRQSSTYYGLGISSIGSTDVVIRFGQYWFPNAATYAQPGQAWSSLANYRWRVRKVSSGAQVGYPVSARNIVGDTSGSVVPTGMLGEVKTISQPSNTNFPASDVYSDIGSFQLTPGIWVLSASIMYQMDNDVTAFQYGTFGFSTTSGNSYPDQLADMSNCNYLPRGLGRTADNAVIFGASIPCFYVNISALTTYYLKITPGTYSGTAPTYRASARAIRIA